tara:strand:+ start:228 stop:665 length:438 start_codon:yes stop_codon:yes gene_type:complete
LPLEDKESSSDGPLEQINLDDQVSSLEIGYTIAMSYKITFVHSPHILYDQNYGVALVPLWAYTLAAHLPGGWQATVFNTQIEKGLNRIAAAEVFAFSGLNKDLDTILAAYRVVKACHPNAIFIVGGPMVWSMKQEGKISLCPAPL